MREFRSDIDGIPKRAPFLAESAFADKDRQVFWVSASAVTLAQQFRGCGRLPQIFLASTMPLAYQANVSTPTTKESHMTYQLCAVTRGNAFGACGMHRAI
jgi:hypothetical protein